MFASFQIFLWFTRIVPFIKPLKLKIILNVFTVSVRAGGPDFTVSVRAGGPDSSTKAASELDP